MCENLTTTHHGELHQSHIIAKKIRKARGSKMALRILLSELDRKRYARVFVCETWRRDKKQKIPLQRQWAWAAMVDIFWWDAALFQKNWSKYCICFMRTENLHLWIIGQWNDRDPCSNCPFQRHVLMGANPLVPVGPLTYPVQEIGTGSNHRLGRSLEIQIEFQFFGWKFAMNTYNDCIIQKGIRDTTWSGTRTHNVGVKVD